MQQHDPQNRGVDAVSAGARSGRLRLLLAGLLGALVLGAGAQTAPPARAEGGADPVALPGADAAAPERVSPLDDELAAKKAAADAAVIGGPKPAPVPTPPEDLNGDGTVIELPIAPAAAPQKQPEAAVPPTTDTSPGPSALAKDGKELQSLRILFPADDSHIDAAAETDLLRVAGYLHQNDTQRVILYAHAGGGQSNSDARRLSLSRALAVRAFLVDKGVPAKRILLRPLGNEDTVGPPDRVDILPLRP